MFDIDANDYDDVRICKCKGAASVCEQCWPLMSTAAQVIDTSLRGSRMMTHFVHPVVYVEFTNNIFVQRILGSNTSRGSFPVVVEFTAGFVIRARASFPKMLELQLRPFWLL